MQRLEFQAQHVSVKLATTACKVLLSYMHSKLFQGKNMKKAKNNKAKSCYWRRSLVLRIE